MSGFLNKRRLLASALAFIAASSASLLWSQTAAPSVAPPPSATAPLDPNAPIAMVNGLPINNAVFYELLIQTGGWRIFQQVLDLALAQRACTSSGIGWAGAEFDTRKTAEFQRYLDSITVEEGTTLTNDQKQNILAEQLRRQGVSNAEFNLRLDRDTCLRALAKGKVDVTPDEIDAWYKAQYGAKVSVNIFQVPDTAAVVSLKSLVEKQKAALNDPSSTIDKQNQILAAVAQSLGIPQPKAVAIPENAPNIDPLKKLAFSLEEKGISDALSFQGAMLVVYAEKKDKSQLDTMKLTTVVDKVKGTTVADKVKQEVYNAKEAQWMNALLNQLRLTAAVTVNQPELRVQYDAWIKALGTANAQAATAPSPGAAAPAIDPMPAAAPAATLKAPIAIPPASRPR